MPVPEAALSKA